LIVAMMSFTWGPRLPCPPGVSTGVVARCSKNRRGRGGLCAKSA
jgi:hypothetical protein